MRSLTGKFLTGWTPTSKNRADKLLEIGLALVILTAPAALARENALAAAPARLAQLTQNGASPADLGAPAMPPADNPAGTFPTGNIPTGNIPTGNIPTGNIPMGNIPMGSAPAGNMPTVPDRAVSDPNAQAIAGQQAPGAPSAEIPKPFHGSVSFEAGSGKILSLTMPAANIYVADPKVAEVRPASSTSLFLFGVGPGHTTIAAVDMLGRLLADYDVTVRPSAFGAREAQATISRLIPGSRVQVKPSGKGMMLMGAVANASDAAQAMMIAKSFSTSDAVDNQMTIASPTQVTLMVRIAEMKRSTARNVGINWQAAAQLGTAVGAKVASPLAPLITGTLGTAACTAGRLCFDTVLNALANEGLAHILAEPNLTVMSGQAASFQAGGEYPYTTPGTGANPAAVSVAFKPYGVLLSFVPTVLGNGRINLHVKPEVSQLDSTNTVQLPGGGIVDGMLVRRTETTVELGSGETFAIAGMLQTTSNSNDSGLPGLGDTPVIGALFKSNAMTREQTELVIIITPILVRPVQNVAQIRLPGDGYKVPGDIDRLLLNRQVPNRDGTVSSRSLGQAGFMVR